MNSIKFSRDNNQLEWFPSNQLTYGPLLLATVDDTPDGSVPGSPVVGGGLNVDVVLLTQQVRLLQLVQILLVLLLRLERIGVDLLYQSGTDHLQIDLEPGQLQLVPDLLVPRHTARPVHSRLPAPAA